MTSPENRLTSLELERLVDGQLSPTEYRRIVAQLDVEPDGWRRCCLAFLEHQALRGELQLLGNFGFDAAVDRAIAGGTASRHVGTTPSGSFQAGKEATPLHNLEGGAGWTHWLKNPLWGLSTLVAASVLIFGMVGLWRGQLSGGLRRSELNYDSLAATVGSGDVVHPENRAAALADRKRGKSSGPPADLARFVALRDSAEKLSIAVPLEVAAENQKSVLPRKMVEVPGSELHSRVHRFSKPYRVELRMFVVVLPTGELGLVPVELVRIEGYQ